jgi:hypothetical protein
MCVRSCTSLVIFGPILSESDIINAKKMCCVNRYAFLKVKHVVRFVLFVPQSGPVNHMSLLYTATDFGILSVLLYFVCLPRFRYTHIEDLYMSLEFSVHISGHIILPPRMHVYVSRQLDVGCMLENLALEMFVSESLSFPLSIIIPPALNTDISYIFHQRCVM